MQRFRPAPRRARGASPTSVHSDDEAVLSPNVGARRKGPRPPVVRAAVQTRAAVHALFRSPRQLMRRRAAGRADADAALVRNAAPPLPPVPDAPRATDATGSLQSAHDSIRRNRDSRRATPRDTRRDTPRNARPQWDAEAAKAMFPKPIRDRHKAVADLFVDTGDGAPGVGPATPLGPPPRCARPGTAHFFTRARKSTSTPKPATPKSAPATPKSPIFRYLCGGEAKARTPASRRYCDAEAFFQAAAPV
ncbi:hypothetical protein M885DRAFT_580933 [Pelagophyceae sp. CCMP2097]|nr:hypothetical protein M885DRAFT_580933 [Pelagophyceae sp. CCMP2097]